MAHKINDNCINCGSCPPECPVDCIGVVGGKHVIDQDICIDCGACAPVCPVEAIDS